MIHAQVRDGALVTLTLDDANQPLHDVAVISAGALSAMFSWNRWLHPQGLRAHDLCE